MKYKFSELINIDKIQLLTDSLCEAMGIALAITDLNGNMLVSSRWQKICTDFHRANPQTCIRCIESDTMLANRLLEGEKYAIYKCRNGLIDAAVPVIIEGRHIVNFFVGQFLFEPPDVEYFLKQARKYGFNETSYLEALSQVPIISKKRIEPILDFFSGFSELLGEMSLKQIRQLEATDALQKEKKFIDTLVQASPAFFVAIDSEGKTIMMNVSLLNALGYSTDEVEGRDYLTTFVPEEDRKPLSQYFKGLVEKHKAQLNQNRVLTKDGRELLVEWHGRPILDEKGELDYFFGVGTDITERKQAEETLLKAFSEIEQLKERLERENIYLREEIEVKYKHEEIIGQSDALKNVLSEAEQVAKTDSTVLILGETGSGKELLARAIHNLSSRKGRAMVKVNCAALPATLIESELFGREKGAYTGALSKQVGRFEVANGSTIFLDEITELSLELQAKLLRVLQEGQFERLGSTQTIYVDVRVIAATNQDLANAVNEGGFREDLYYRLNVFPISVPPLRERQEDIPLLVWEFVKELGKTMGKQIDTIPRKSMEAMQRYPWPGNIRELRNVIERAMILSRDSTLRVALPEIAASKTYQNTTLEEIERKHILNVLERTGWRIRGKNGAAEILGLKPSTLESRMLKRGVKRRK